MAHQGAIVGRRAELARLGAIVDGAEGRSALALVLGEPGMGKSRLLAEVGTTAAATGHRVLRGGADELDPAPLGLWHGPARALGLPRLGADGTVPVSELRWEALDLLRGALLGCGPAVLALEDLHWADDASLWLLERLSDDLLDVPVAFLATSRPGTEAREPRWAAVRRRADVVALDGLDADEIAQLAGALGAPADADHGELRRRTGGNPLLITEVLSNPGAPLPPSVSDVLTAAVERRGPAVAETLSLLALAGPATPPTVLAAARGLSADEVLAHLDDAIAAGVLVVQPEPGRWFRHALLADAAAARMDPGTRARAHLELADAWAAVGGGADVLAASARHRLDAVPLVDAVVAAGDATRAAADLVARRGHAEAARLLARAGDVVATHAPSAAEQRARLHLAEADAHDALDDALGATNSAQRALEQAARTGDLTLQAAAEVAAIAHHNPFVADPVRLARLAVLDEHLTASPTPDLGLRARLRGRRSILSVSFPDRLDDAVRLGDLAVADARGTGRPEVVIAALSDRHFAATTRHDLATRDAAAEEVVALAEQVRRPDLALLGHEWRYGARLRQGDLTGALAALADLEALAALMPSPRWRLSAGLRRSGVLAIVGDRDGALDVIGAAVDAGRGAFDPVELTGLELGARVSVAVLYGTPAPDLAPLHDALAAAMGAAPMAFIQIHLAFSAVVLGDLDAGRRRLRPWAHRAEAALRGPEGLASLSILAMAFDRLQWPEPAAALAALLAPFAGLLPTVNGIGANLPVDAHLASLALLADDPGAAAVHAQRALALSRSMPAPPLEARSLALLAEAQGRVGERTAALSARDAAEAMAEPIGMVLGPPTWAATAPGPGTGTRSTVPAPGPARAREQPGPATVGGTATLRRRGARWELRSPHGGGTLPHSIGVGQLARLLAAPGVEVTAVDLAGAGHADAVPVSSDLGPALDARAKREYRQRISELQAEIDEADDHHDLARAARHRDELDALLGELRRAVGRAGRDRPQGSGAERARINVARSLRRALAAVEAEVPALGAHLRVSVRTGHRCSYAPEPAAALNWTISENADGAADLSPDDRAAPAEDLDRRTDPHGGLGWREPR